MTIPADQLAGYCCPLPMLQFDWLLGTVDGDTSARVVALTNLKCVNCGTDYRFKGTATLVQADNGRTIVLDIEVPPVVLQ